MQALKLKLLNLNMVQDNEYLDKYVNLIENNQLQEPIINNTQQHHIIPRWYFKHCQLSIDDSPDNLVNLFFKDHILAHYYLSLFTTGELRCAMRNAFLMLNNFNPDLEMNKLDHYQLLYEETCLARQGVEPPNKGKPMNEEQKIKISNALKGRTYSLEIREKMRLAQLNMSPEKKAHIIEAAKNRNYKPSEETKLRQSIALQGHPVSQEAKKKIGAANKEKLLGGLWCNNGSEALYIRPGESIPEGYVRGTLRKGKHWYNNGVRQLQAYECPEGYVKGRLSKNR